jgi:hypothetical protein
VDLEAIWQQHKRFILRVALGAFLFTVLLTWRSSIAAEAAALVRSNASLQGALQDDMARLENAEGLEKGRADALGARLEPAVLRAVGWKLEPAYELPKGERSPELLYASLAARAATEVESAASRWNASVPKGSQGLGMQGQPAKTRVGEALAQVDLHRRLAIKLLDAGVRTIAKLDPQDPRYLPRDAAGKGFVRQLPVRVTFQASAATLAKALAELQVEGTFVELLACKVTVRPGKPGMAQAEPLEVELEVQALSLVEAMPEGVASADAQPRGGRRGPRRFGRER